MSPNINIIKPTVILQDIKNFDNISPNLISLGMAKNIASTYQFNSLMEFCTVAATDQNVSSLYLENTLKMKALQGINDQEVQNILNSGDNIFINTLLVYNQAMNAIHFLSTAEKFGTYEENGAKYANFVSDGQENFVNLMRLDNKVIGAFFKEIDSYYSAKEGKKIFSSDTSLYIESMNFRQWANDVLSVINGREVPPEWLDVNPKTKTDKFDYSAHKMIDVKTARELEKSGTLKRFEDISFKILNSDHCLRSRDSIAKQTRLMSDQGKTAQEIQNILENDPKNYLIDKFVTAYWSLQAISHLSKASDIRLRNCVSDLGKPIQKIKLNNYDYPLALVYFLPDTVIPEIEKGVNYISKNLNIINDKKLRTEIKNADMPDLLLKIKKAVGYQPATEINEETKTAAGKETAEKYDPNFISYDRLQLFFSESKAFIDFDYKLAKRALNETATKIKNLEKLGGAQPLTTLFNKIHELLPAKEYDIVVENDIFKGIKYISKDGKNGFIEADEIRTESVIKNLEALEKKVGLELNEKHKNDISSIKDIFMGIYHQRSMINCLIEDNQLEQKTPILAAEKRLKGHDGTVREFILQYSIPAAVEEEDRQLCIETVKKMFETADTSSSIKIDESKANGVVKLKIKGYLEDLRRINPYLEKLVGLDEKPRGATEKSGEMAMR